LLPHIDLVVRADPILAGVLVALLGGAVSCASSTPGEPTPAFRRDVAVGQRWYETGVGFAKRNQHEKAINAFANALRNDPMHGLAHLEKAESHLFVDADAAVIRDHLLTAVELLPQNPRAYQRLGEAMAAVGDEDAAIRHWRTALSLRPGLVDARLQLATMLVGTGALDEAREHLEKAVRQEPKNVRARVRLGEVLETASRPGDAARQIEFAAQMVGRSAALYRRAAKLYESAGEDPQARRLRRKADEIDPPPPARDYRPLRRARRRR